MKSFLLILLLASISFFARCEVPSFTLNEGDALKVTIERMKPQSSNGNTRLSVQLTPKKADEFKNFTEKCAGQEFAVIVTNLKHGSLLVGHTILVSRQKDDGTVSLCYSTLKEANDASYALLESPSAH